MSATRRWCALFLILLAGCAHPTEPPAATSIVLSKNIGVFAGRWEREAATRFEHPIVVIVHGATIDGKLYVFPDGTPPMSFEGTAKLLRTLYPDRPIVIACCNEDGVAVHGFPGIYYARRIVWYPPGVKRDGVSRISGFIEAK